MRFISSICVVFMIFGCTIGGVLGNPQRYIHREVSNSELVGTWRATADSIEEQSAFSRTYPDWPASVQWSSMTLNDDGTCRLTIEPLWRGENGQQYEQPDCMWKVTKAWAVENTSELAVVVSFEDFGKSSLYIYEENGGLTLWSFIGDPDDWDMLDFRKSP